MSLQIKRRIFFIVVTILYFALAAIVMLHPILEWADTKTLQGVTVIGVPLSQFMVLFCAFSLAILVTVLYNVDTKVLTIKAKEEKGGSGNGDVDK